MDDEKQIDTENVTLDEEITGAAFGDAPVNDDVARDNATDDAAAGSDADCGGQVDALINEVRELNDKYLRIAAELENTRRRASRDVESASRNRAMTVVRNFLPVMDAIESALTHNPDDAGIVAMHRAMTAAFESVGVVRIASVGEKLNPAHHNAIQVVDSPDNESGTVVTEMQPGYMFDDNVLRTAMVVVAK